MSPQLPPHPARWRLLAVAASGAALGFAIESGHRLAGVWILDRGAVPWWIAAVYFLTIAAVGWGLYRLEARRGFVLHPAPRRRVLVEALLLVALFAAPVLLHDWEIPFTAACAALLVFRLLLFRQRADGLVVILVVMADLLVESSLVGLSLYHYARADYLPLPLWLAPLWGCIGLSLRRVLFAALSPQATDD